MKNRIILIILIFLAVISVAFTVTGYLESKKDNKEENSKNETTSISVTTKDSYDLVDSELLFSNSLPVIMNNKLYYSASGFMCLFSILPENQCTNETINKCEESRLSVCSDLTIASELDSCAEDYCQKLYDQVCNPDNACRKVIDDENVTDYFYLFESDLDMKNSEVIYKFDTTDEVMYNLFDDTLLAASINELIFYNPSSKKASKIMDMTDSFAQYIIVSKPITKADEFGIIYDSSEKALLTIFDRKGNKISEGDFNHSYNYPEVYRGDKNYYTLKSDSNDIIIYKNNSFMSKVKDYNNTYFVIDETFYGTRYDATNNKIIVEDYSNNKTYDMDLVLKEQFVDHIRDNYFRLSGELYYYDTKTNKFISLNEKVEEIIDYRRVNDYLVVQTKIDNPKETKTLIINTKNNTVKTIKDTIYFSVDKSTIYLYYKDSIKKYKE